jgi:hypothetical protein
MITGRAVLTAVIKLRLLGWLGLFARSAARQER